MGPRPKTTEVEARMALVCASTDDGRPLTGGTNLIGKVVDCVASGSGPCIKGTHKCQKFSTWFGVKLSRCMCSHISCPSWRNGWHNYVILTFITGRLSYIGIIKFALNSQKNLKVEMFLGLEDQFVLRI